MGREDYYDVNGTFVIDNDEGYEGTVAIPKDVTGIMWYSLSGCKSITSIKIPESLVKIDFRAFSSCASLKEIIVDENNPYYSSKDGVLYSKDMSILYVVPKCKDSIEIPDSVTRIGEGAFDCSSSLKEIHLKHKNPVDFSHAFEANVTIYVPKGSGDAYRNSGYYKKFREIIEEE